jgi:hypothetical protein
MNVSDAQTFGYRPIPRLTLIVVNATAIGNVGRTALAQWSLSPEIHDIGTSGQNHRPNAWQSSPIGPRRKAGDGYGFRT